VERLRGRVVAGRPQILQAPANRRENPPLGSEQQPLPGAATAKWERASHQGGPRPKKPAAARARWPRRANGPPGSAGPARMVRVGLTSTVSIPCYYLRWRAFNFWPRRLQDHRWKGGVLEGPPAQAGALEGRDGRLRGPNQIFRGDDCGMNPGLGEKAGGSASTLLCASLCGKGQAHPLLGPRGLAEFFAIMASLPLFSLAGGALLVLEPRKSRGFPNPPLQAGCSG